MVPLPTTPSGPTSPFPSSGTPQPSSLSRLTLSDKLLLSQAVHHIGASPPDWGRVSSILLSHPLIRTKGRLEQASKAGITLGRVFGSRECERAWVALMRQYSLVLQPGEKDTMNESEGESSGSTSLANRSKEARGLPPKTDRASQLALAQFLYAERIREIQESIKIKEQKFKSLVADIEALQSGTLDATLAAEVAAINAQAVTTPSTEPSVRAAPKERAGVTAPPAVATPGSRTRTSRSGSSAAPPTTSLEQTSPVVESTVEVETTAPDVSKEVVSGEKEVRDSDEIAISGQDELETTGGGEADQDITMEITGDKAVDTAVDDSVVPLAVESADIRSNTAVQIEPSDPVVNSEKELDTAAEIKQTRSSKRKRDSDAGLEQRRKSVTQEVEMRDAAADKEVEIEEAEEDPVQDVTSKKRPEPRRSRRSGRGAEVIEEPSGASTPTTPASAVASTTKNRLGVLRSRETSGTSAGEAEEEGNDTADGDITRSTNDRTSRASNSPVSVRRGRGTSRLSNSVANNRQSRGGSNTSRTEVEQSEMDREKAKRKNEKVLLMLLNDVSNHTHGNLFHSAIKEQDAPDYYALIRHPVDLKTIKARVKEGSIVNSTQLRRSLNQMFANSLIYNRPGTEIHRMALEMRDAAEAMIDRFEQTQLSASYSRR